MSTPNPQEITLGQIEPSSNWGQFNNLSFIIGQLLGRMQTCTLVQVTAVSDTDELSPVGTVTILPLVNQVGASGNAVPLAPIANVPYFRLQGGSSAIVMLPKVGDIGIAVFASRDISTVKNAKVQSNPGSNRQYSFADAIYIGGILNSTPDQYLQFLANSINTVSSGTVSTEAEDIQLTSTTLEIDAQTTIAGDIDVTGATTLNGALSVSGVSTLNGNVSVTGNQNVTGVITASEFIGPDGPIGPGGGGSGTVTSVGLTMPPSFQVANSPITSAGSFNVSITTGYYFPTITDRNNWNIAYTQSLEWSGGAANLNATLGRVSLGATTLGGNLFTLANPSALTYVQINADNSVTLLNASAMLAALGGGTGSGTVTSVGMTITGGILTVGGSPITTSGTLAVIVAGTSGGIPYFNSASTWATSSVLSANSIMIGGGAGIAPSTVTTGTGVITALGVAVGSAGAFVVNGGALGTPSSGNLINCTFPTLNQNTTGTASNVTGTVTTAHGGTNLTATPTNGQLLIGNGAGYTLATITPGAGVTVTNGSGSITIAATSGTAIPDYVSATFCGAL